ncbi:MAG: cupredoxin domain-containing protein [Acidobacteria bacterium]|nr:cupredoxin domain-containing protein [Acidobacteriota bacterium]
MRNTRRSQLLAPIVLLIATGNCIAQDTSSPIEVHVHRFSFQPTEITVHKGEPAVVKLVSDDVTHSLVVKGLGINQTVSKDHPADIHFTPTASGDFRGQCGRFCGKGHGSMFFTIHVK